MVLTLPPEFEQYKPWIILEKLNDFKLNPVDESASPEILHTFTAQRIAWYSVNNWVGGLLLEYYQEDFAAWNKHMMTKCDKSIINLLRDFLVKHGIYIPRNRTIGNGAKLLTLLKEEVHEWTHEEIIYQKKHGGGFSAKFDPYYGQLPPMESDVSTSREIQSRKVESAKLELKDFKIQSQQFPNSRDVNQQLRQENQAFQGSSEEKMGSHPGRSNIQNVRNQIGIKQTRNPDLMATLWPSPPNGFAK